MKRIVPIGDTHCGHVSGLTPPAWWVSEEWCEKQGRDWRTLQETCWNTYVEIIESLKPIHGVLIGGDCGDGTERREHGLELIEPSIVNQSKMAVECLKVADAKHYAGVYGTHYHVGDQFEIDTMVSELLGATIAPVQDVVVNGTRIRWRHKIGGSATPVGGDIALRKKDVNNVLWGAKQGMPIADIQVFFHVHRWRQLDDKVMSVPGLQAWTNYGGMQCDGEVHWGLTWIDIEDDGSYRINKKLIPLSTIDNMEALEW